MEMGWVGFQKVDPCPCLPSGASVTSEWIDGWMNERQLELICDNVDEESNVARRCFVVLFRIQIATFV